MNDEQKPIPLSKIGGLPEKRVPPPQPNAAAENGISSPEGSAQGAMAAPPHWAAVQLSPIPVVPPSEARSLEAASTEFTLDSLTSPGPPAAEARPATNPTPAPPALTQTTQAATASPARATVGGANPTNPKPGGPAASEAAGAAQSSLNALNTDEADAQRFYRSGTFEFTERGNVIPQHQVLEFEHRGKSNQDPGYLLPSAALLARRKWGRLAWVWHLFHPQTPRNWLKWCAAIGLPIIGISLCIILIMRSRHKDASSESVQRDQDLRATQESAAKITLTRFLTSKEPTEIAPLVLSGSDKLHQIKEAIRNADIPVTDQAQLVTPIPLTSSDVAAGLVAFMYEVPLETTPLMKPLLPMDVALSTKDPSALEEMAMLAAAFEERPPRKALVMFRYDGTKARLDWDLLMQTWNRTLRDFGTVDGEDTEGRFRVVLTLDKPVFENNESLDDIIVRINDPCHQEDVIRVAVRHHAPEALALRTLERRSSAEGPSTTATVDLRADAKTGKILLDGIVCWQFLGLGGQEGNIQTTTRSE